MFRYFIRRVLMMFPVLLGISFILFAIMDLTPGDPARILLGEYAEQQAVDDLREEMGLNRNFFTRYFNYVSKALRGDFGESWRTRSPVTGEIVARYPATLQIAVYAMILSTLIGIPIGVVSAIRRYSIIDVASTIVALIFTSIPAFWLGLLMILLFSQKLGWLPAVGSETWKHFIIPSIAMAAAHMASMVRMTRSSMLEVIRQDYIRTARAKGASESRIIFRHAMRNTLLPIVTVFGINFGLLLGGALIIENVCGISGLGTVMVTAVKSKDTPLLIASVLFAATISGFLNLAVDMLYTYIDPRIRSQYVNG